MSARRTGFQAIVRNAFRRIVITRNRLLMLVVATFGMSKERSQNLQHERAEGAQDARHTGTTRTPGLSADWANRGTGEQGCQRSPPSTHAHQDVEASWKGQASAGFPIWVALY
jgi:hypothetical protein